MKGVAEDMAEYSEVGRLNYPAAVEDAMVENLRTMYKEVSKLALKFFESCYKFVFKDNLEVQ